MNNCLFNPFQWWTTPQHEEDTELTALTEQTKSNSSLKLSADNLPDLTYCAALRNMGRCCFIDYPQCGLFTSGILLLGGGCIGMCISVGATHGTPALLVVTDASLIGGASLVGGSIGMQGCISTYGSCFTEQGVSYQPNFANLCNYS